MDQPSHRSIALASIVVFLIAILLRVPSCYESFWVDELHSAWCVWDDLGDVAQRADIGHQSPFYFTGLWFWKQFVGNSELALRMSSVLAVAVGCSVLTAGIAKYSHSVLAGATAGAVLAIENNSIFFGTELRPFAFVILFASMATVCFANLASLTSRHGDRRSWIGLIIAILLAALCQPTSLGVLWLLPAALGCLWLWQDRRQCFRITLTDGLLLIAVAAVTFALWSMTLEESWGQRGTWASFASATSILQAWQAWDWTWLGSVPLAMLALTFWTSHTGGNKIFGITILMALLAVIGTLSYWLVAWMEWLPLWHRRYFVAVLPILAFVSGGSIAVVSQCDRVRKLAPLLAICIVGGLMYRQDMYRSLARYPVAFAVRGEDWRGAIEWINSEAKSNDRIYLESGLIESNRWLSGAGIRMGGTKSPWLPNQEQRRYLLYPTQGPYQLDHPVEVINADLALPLEVLYDDRNRIFLIVRRPENKIQIDPTKWGWVYGNRNPSEIKSFGNVTAISMITSDETQE